MNKSVGRFENWSERCERELNKHILKELFAQYQYHALFAYFDRDSVALENIAAYFDKASSEERDHAHDMIKYQNKRGGDVVFYHLPAPHMEFETSEQRSNLLIAFEMALELEQDVFRSLKVLHDVASEEGDAQFCDYLESNYLEEQVEANNELAKYITKLKLIGLDGHGLYQFNENFSHE